jgi:DNA-binding transcriptional MocR family regulator
MNEDNMASHLFYLDEKGSDRIRLQFSLEDEEKILKGVKIIGEELSNEVRS